MAEVLALVVVTLFLAYANGANDNFKGVATLFGSRTTNYRRALWWADGSDAFCRLLVQGRCSPAPHRAASPVPRAPRAVPDPRRQSFRAVFGPAADARFRSNHGPRCPHTQLIAQPSCSGQALAKQKKSRRTLGPAKGQFQALPLSGQLLVYDVAVAQQNADRIRSEVRLRRPGPNGWETG